MNKKELEKMREKLKAENPLLTEDQIEDIIAESESGSEDTGGGEGALHTPDSGAPNANALTQEREALEAEKVALAKEKADFEAEKKRLAEKEAALAAAGPPQASGKTAGSDSGKPVAYECKTRCTFDGRYYREGERLTTTGEVPDFF